MEKQQKVLRILKEVKDSYGYGYDCDDTLSSINLYHFFVEYT